MQTNSISSIFERFAPSLFILVWACGYIVAKYATPYAPPLTFLCLRYIGIVGLLGSLAYFAKVPLPRGKLLWHSIIVGVVMQCGYLAGVWVGIAQGMPAGVMALLVNLQPILTAIFTVLFLQQPSQVNSNINQITETHVSPRQWLGLILGLAGVILVLFTKLNTASYANFGWPAIILGVGALLCITLGTLYQKHFCPGIDPRASQTVQSLASFCVTLPFALTTETQPIVWTIQFWGALIFSVVVLSGIGTGLLLWLINRGAITKVTAYLYWVPPVSSLLAWLMFDERITLLAWPGFILVALGVMLVVKQSTSTK